MKRLEGKTALAHGAVRGIGRAICEGFARKGAHVAVADLPGEDAEGTATAIQVLRMQTDIAEACITRASNVAQHLAWPHQK